MSLLSDVQIRGAGVIGLSLALELATRGARVSVLHREFPQTMASIAAAGMLAVDDPHNPPALLPLSRLSRDLYPAFLARVAALSGQEVPFQTQRAHQTMPDGTSRTLHEHSLDPRQLLPALRAAVLAAGVTITARETSPSQAVVYATGAWRSASSTVKPRKGQMLRVRLPADLPLAEVYRAEHVYLVPRTRGPQAGTALIGATVEEAGFDTTLSPPALDHLRELAADFVPAIADASVTPMVEAWAGLRPTTPDGLPLLGVAPQDLQSAADSATLSHHGASAFIATGHFRNGILLAPATAVVMADLLEGRRAQVDLTPFAPSRFGHLPPRSSPAADDIRPTGSDNAFSNLT